MWKLNMTLLVASVMIMPVQAEPTVIYQTNQTTYFKDKPNTTQFQFAPPAHYQGEFNPLPVVTPTLTPGRVQPRKINRPFLNQPIFIVGADRLSLLWLKQHRKKLQDHHATGIAVNVKTKEQLANLVKASGGLPVNPVRGNKIARQLALQHYPVLVSATRIEQ